MASINGLSVMKIRKFTGHHGESLYQGSLCLNNEEIGFWSQDNDNGPDTVSLAPLYSKQLLNSAIKAKNPDKAFHGIQS